jgi:hypothetical protein
MSQFRSEEMALIQLFIRELRIFLWFSWRRTSLSERMCAENDAANETLHELGQINAIQFKDVSQ